MRVLFMLLIGIAVAAGVYYMTVMQGQGSVKMQVDSAKTEAQQKADEYKKKQADMMRALEQ